MPTDRYPSSRPRPGGPRPGGDRPNYSSDRPNYSADRPNFSGGDRPSADRPSFSSGPRTFTPRPAAPPEAVAAHSIRVRDGDREVEVSGSPAFVRQAIDDLPDLLARLRGERKGAAATSHQSAATRSISMPAPSVPGPSMSHDESPLPVAVTPANGRSTGAAATVADGAVASAPGGARGPATKAAGPRAKRHAVAHSLEEQVIGILAGQKRPVTVAAIRKKLTDDVSGQLVRRTLERSDRVTATDDRPAAYRLR